MRKDRNGAYPRAEKYLHWHWNKVRDALPKYAVPIGRGSGRGQPTSGRGELIY
jgi:hypothetical protein